MRKSIGCRGVLYASLFLLLLNELLEYFGIILGEVGENFSVQFYILFFKLINKLAVGKAVLSGGGVYFYLPQPPEISFFLFSVGKLE